RHPVAVLPGDPAVDLPQRRRTRDVLAGSAGVDGMRPRAVRTGHRAIEQADGLTRTGRASRAVRTTTTEELRGSARVVVGSESASRDPLAHQRVDDHVPVALAGNKIVLRERGQRILNARCAPQTAALPDVAGQQLAALLDHD